jgi:sec-independent protein translocase protein TatC
MVTETEEPRTQFEEEEQEGGPVKPFLEHLEDLRWTLIKSASTLAVAFVICLLAGNYVVEILKRPLAHGKIKYPAHVQVVRLMVGTNRLGEFQLPIGPQTASAFGTNRIESFQLVPIATETNLMLGLRREAGSASADTQLEIPLVNFGPASAFVVATKVAFYGGMVLAAPFIFYFVGQFVFPALKLREKKYAYRGLLFGGGLFAGGVAFCYFALMPIALVASVQFSQWLGFAVNQWRAEDYISFVCKFMLGMGLGFELPVVVLTLVKIGILNYKMLSKGRRYVIVICLVLGAVLTTPEVVTQVLMAVPLYVLYEITVWIAWYWERKERKRQEAAEA